MQNLFLSTHAHTDCALSAAHSLTLWLSYKTKLTWLPTSLASRFFLPLSRSLSCCCCCLLLPAFFVLCVPRCSLALSQLLLLRFVVGFVPLTCLLVFVLARFVLCFCKTRTLLCYCCRWCQIHTYEHTCTRTHKHTDVVAMCEVYVNMRWWNTGQMANVQCVNWNWKREIKNCRKLYNKATKNKFKRSTTTKTTVKCNHKITYTHTHAHTHMNTSVLEQTERKIKYQQPRPARLRPLYN